MQNCDKAILVAYLDVSDRNKASGMQALNNFKHYLETLFYNENEINDDSLVILVVPSDRTEIQLLNARYPDYKKLEEFAQHKLIEYLENEKICDTK